MNIVLSPAFFDSYRSLDRDMHELLVKHASTDLCQVRRGRDLLPGQKTVIWEKSEGAAVLRRPDVPPEAAGVIWVDASELGPGGLSLEVMLGELVMRRRSLERKFVVIVGVHTPAEKNRLAPKILSLMAHQRAIVRMCATVEDGLMVLYRWTLAINPYLMVMGNSRLAQEKTVWNAVEFVMRIQGISVVEAKHVVERFPSVKELWEGVKARQIRDDTTAAEPDSIPEWIWDSLVRLIIDSGRRVELKQR
ncbi:hypothetical protein V5O48_009072 [Marasmius crinis-equi]|uniref:ERCC4 domain-containing protein n=1 Tax=Marasmius crinis-equi TaxID=585013 RepID=A0ABR3FCH5_9AGAR